mgnify:CR=1 FL=1
MSRENRIRDIPITFTIPESMIGTVVSMRCWLGMKPEDGVNGTAREIFLAGLRNLFDDDKFMAETKKMIAYQRKEREGKK